jgi:hypothetical protein
MSYAELDFERHTMPNGSECWYRDSDHSYWLGVEPKRKRDPEGDWKGVGRLTGVSTAASPFDFQPDALMRWAAKTNGIGIAELVNCALNMCDEDPTLNLRDELTWLLDAETIWKALERDSLTFNDIRDQAAERGTNVHKHSLYELALGKPVSAHDEMTEDEQGYARGVEAFWLEHMPETFQAEKVVLDAELGIAGRFDWRGRLQARCGRPTCPCRAIQIVGEDNPSMLLLDAKTSGFIPLKHHVQIAGYGHCCEVCGIGSCDAAWILQVDGDGGWELVPGQATAEDFMGAVDVYRRAARIDSAAKADRKIRAAA